MLCHRKNNYTVFIEDVFGLFDEENPDFVMLHYLFNSTYQNQQDIVTKMMQYISTEYSQKKQIKLTLRRDQFINTELVRIFNSIGFVREKTENTEEGAYTYLFTA